MQSQSIFITPKETCYPLSSCFHFPPPLPLAATHLSSVSMNLPILGISYEWNHKMCDLLCLASFTQHIILGGSSILKHVACRTKQYFIPFYGQLIFHCMYLSWFTHSSVDGQLCCFNLLATVNSAAMNVCTCIV